MTSQASEPTYYARDGRVFKSPVSRKHADGSTGITLGFPICDMHDAAGDEAAPVLALLMNRGEVLPDFLEAANEVSVLLDDLTRSGHIHPEASIVAKFKTALAKASEAA
jgi:hypothetical protein